jgi:hypothetical protein
VPVCRDFPVQKRQRPPGKRKGVTRATKSLQIANFESGRPAPFDNVVASTNSHKSPAIQQKNGARGTRTPDLLGAIHQLSALDQRRKLPISGEFLSRRGVGARRA